MVLGITALVIVGALPSYVGATDQQGAVQPNVSNPDHHDVSPPLGSIQPSSGDVPSARGKDRHAKRTGQPPNELVAAPGSETNAAAAPAVGTSFDGIGLGLGSYQVLYAPPDPNGALGPNHYVEVVNVDFAVFSKGGALLYGPTSINTLWSGFGGCELDNDGDPNVIYDRISDRWLVSQFAVTTTHYLNCVAVSQTGDPLGAYNRYSHSYTDFPDYPKFGLWPDGYYVSFNMFSGGTTFSGPTVCSYDRVKMLAGPPAAQVCFNLGTAYASLLPSTLDGATAPPAGSPNYFLNFGTNSLNLWKFHADFATPSNSTFTGPTSIPVEAFSTTAAHAVVVSVRVGADSGSAGRGVGGDGASGTRPGHRRSPSPTASARPRVPDNAPYQALAWARF